MILAATYTWWGPFGINNAEAVIREATTIKTTRTGNMLAIEEGKTGLWFV